MFTYTLLGMELFAHKVKINDDAELDLVNGSSTRYNFDTFFHGFTTIFVTLTGDSWNYIMYEYVRFDHVQGVLYFISLVIFGRFLLLNLFLAILLNNYDSNNT